MPPFASPLAAYAELDCLSNFSFLRGASHPEELVERAVELGYEALALSDDCSMAGVVRAHQAVKKLREQGHPDFRLIVGSRFRLQSADGLPWQLVLLARSINGYGNLCEFITQLRTRTGDRNSPALLTTADILHMPGHPHLQGLPDCLAILVPPYCPAPPQLESWLSSLSPAFRHRFWLGLALHLGNDDPQHRHTLAEAAQRHGLPLTAAGQVEMHVRSRQPVHDAMTAIRLHESIPQCGGALQANAERHLRSRSRLARIYPADCLRETLNISRQCTFDLDEIRYCYPTELVPAGQTPDGYLRQETLAGARRRYPQGIPVKVRAQLETELAIIASLKYEVYFLTVHDIVQFARRRGILCQGRGSAANSAVCYCLGITEVDPENGNLLFARFISQERNEPPDIDVDFEHQRREEVIQYIYGKYGRQRAALTAVVITYRTRSALRDTGKALGLDLAVIESVLRSCQYWDGRSNLLDRIAAQGLDPGSHIARTWAALAEAFLGFPRHLSQHPGGFVMAQGKLSRLVPIENAAMPNRSVVQWDKDDLDTMGLLKVDVLALGMLSALRRTLDLAGRRRGQPLMLEDIPHSDPETYDMICRADTIGVFQIESRAQMSMLPRLQPRTFYDLVVQVAIVRPGPIHGDMVHPFLRRRRGEEKIAYPTPQVEHILKRTLGVPIFQEQVMQIAMIAAGFTPGEADELRRSMAAWRRKGGVDHLRTRLIEGMIANGYPEDFAQAIYRQLEGFGEYGFPESHAASFAKLAYFSAWLKRHEPEAFLAALLNSQPMGFYSPSQLVQDARRHDVTVLPIDVQTSRWEAGLEAVSADAASRPAVRLGLNMVRGLSAEAAHRIHEARQAHPFSGAQDLALRADLTRNEMDALAAADALTHLSGHRRLARWEASSMPLKGLLREAVIAEGPPPALAPMSEAQDIRADYQATGLTLGRHPLALLRDTLQERRFSTAAMLHASCPDRRLVRACGLVTTRQRPQTAKGIVFVSLEDETGVINVIVRPELAQRQRVELLQSRLLGVYGVWQRKDEVCHLLASRLVRLDDVLGDLAFQSRNFH